MADALPVDSAGLAAQATFAVGPAEIVEIAVALAVVVIAMKKAVLVKRERDLVVLAIPVGLALFVARCNCATGYLLWGLHSHFHS